MAGAAGGDQTRSGSGYQLVCDGCSDEPEPLGVRDAFSHYREGSGLMLKAPFSQLGADVGPDYFSGFRSALAEASPGDTFIISATAPFKTVGNEALTFGYVTLHLQGELSVGYGGWWSFEGKVSALNDIYDFNASTHRSWFGEAATWAGRQFDGKPYEIQFVGSKNVYANGTIPSKQFY